MIATRHSLRIPSATHLLQSRRTYDIRLGCASMTGPRGRERAPFALALALLVECRSARGSVCRGHGAKTRALESIAGSTDRIDGGSRSGDGTRVGHQVRVWVRVAARRTTCRANVVSVTNQ